MDQTYPLLEVIGIDPSLTGTGIAHQFGVERAGGDAGLGDARLEDIYDTVKRAATPKPSPTPRKILAVLEDLPANARGAGYTGKSQGVIRLALRHAGAEYVLVTAATLKSYATGTGNASKSDMRMVLYKRMNIDIADDNIVDAMWLRQMGLDAIGHWAAYRLPTAQRRRMLKVTWPGMVDTALRAELGGA